MPRPRWNRQRQQLQLLPEDREGEAAMEETGPTLGDQSDEENGPAGDDSPPSDLPGPRDPDSPAPLCIDLRSDEDGDGDGRASSSPPRGPP